MADPSADGTPWFERDTDGDGVFDDEEFRAGTSPESTDTDGDGLPDSKVSIRLNSNDANWDDPDGNGFSRGQEAQFGTSNHEVQTPQQMGEIIDAGANNVFGQIAGRQAMGLPIPDGLRGECDAAIANLQNGSLFDRFRADGIANKIDGTPLDPDLGAVAAQNIDFRQGSWS